MSTQKDATPAGPTAGPYTVNRIRTTDEQSWSVSLPFNDPICLCEWEQDARQVAGGLDALAACTPERLDALGLFLSGFTSPSNLNNCNELLTLLRQAVARATVGGEGEQVTP